MRFCTECGGEVSAGQKFCAHCGARLQSLPPSSESAAARPPSTPQSPGRALPTATIIHEPDSNVAFPRSGSMLLADRPDPPAHVPVRYGIPPLAVLSGMLLAIVLSALAGYWWFSGRQTPTPAAAVEATEQALDAGGAQAVAPRDAASVEQMWTVVADATRGATDATEAIGPVDQKTAVIAPGGALALAYRNGPFFYNGPGADIEIRSPGGERTRYTIFAREDAAGPWLRFDVNSLGLGNGVAGHDMGHHGMERARQIMIKNEGGAALSIDAVTPLHMEPAAHDDDHAGGPAKPRVRR